MSDKPDQNRRTHPFRQYIVRPWLALLGVLQGMWIRTRVLPEDIEQIKQRCNGKVLYVLEHESLSSELILQRLCKDLGLPLPLQPPPPPFDVAAYAMFAVVRRPRLFRRRRNRTPRVLTNAIDAVSDGTEDATLVPVSILLGRAPDKQHGVFKILFSERWGIGGRLRRLFSILVHGRGTEVQFGEPLSVRQALEEKQQPAKAARKLMRYLRISLRRHRAASIGPDLSHRRTMIEGLLRSEPVRSAIQGVSEEEGISPEKATRRAHKYALEIVSDYSYATVRLFSRILTPLWNRIYDGVVTHHLETVREAAGEHEVIYVPCHRSHIDYLLISFLLHANSIVLPHIAAGNNLNVPVLGPILRRGGAFFLRRSFRDNPLYSAVFHEYVAAIFSRGVALEYFVEGTRSRTGRTLPARLGMLTITVRSFLRAHQRPVVFVPVYIGYEKLVEGKTYLNELSGRRKQKESLWQLFRAVKILRQQYGKVHVNFGKPIPLAPVLDQYQSDWRNTPLSMSDRPQWLGDTVQDLADRITTGINASVDVNPINLLGLVLLATPRQALSEDDLVRQLDLSKTLLTELPYDERVTVTELDGAQIVEYGLKMGWVKRREHKLGDIIYTDGEQSTLLAYFRNNVLHLYAIPSWIACCFLNNRRFPRKRIIGLGSVIYPFVKQELFLPWSNDDFAGRVNEMLEVMKSNGLLSSSPGGRNLERAAGGERAALQLSILAHGVLQTFRRYYITIALLAKHGQGTLTTRGLMNLCHLTAQRLSILIQFDAPDFFDKTLFKQFIEMLKERGVIWTNSERRIEWDEQLNNIANDAKEILGKSIRHSILQVAPGALDDEEGS